MILCDTSIYFEIFRDNGKVIEEVKKIGFGNLALCDLSIGEIYFGMRKGEERKTKELVNLFQRFHFTKEVSKIFVETMANHFGRKITIPDALIASFAKANGTKLFTLNVKDFKEVKDLLLYKPTLKLK